MAEIVVGIILNGATGRICSTQHLQNALLPIRDEGGLPLGQDRIVPHPVLLGRNDVKLASIARHMGISEWSTDISEALSRDDCSIFFDAAATHQRFDVLSQAIAAGKHVYAEKPLGQNIEQGVTLLREAGRRGCKHGCVEDKLLLPGIQKLRKLLQTDYFGDIIGFHLNFGWWVFDGKAIPCQRPSWNYRRQSGGGIILDMYPHWRYVIEGTVGPIKQLVSSCWTATKERVDESGIEYQVDVDDSAATLIELESGAFGTVTSSWATRVRSDDLFTLKVDGTKGSAIAGLHECLVQPLSMTPKVQWNPNENIRADYHGGWGNVPDTSSYKNSYREGWEAFLRHVIADTPMFSDFRAGIRDVMFGERCYQSIRERKWVSMVGPEY